ncbi:MULTISPECIES: GGDEF domain-containing protein [Methylomicrobium]|uniref:diguanylate cyclase n=1 Tax=Methylomicrobium album BG8 TaxID=686340 RepID=H8GJK4_METAL|nr:MULTISPECIES: GGDEF domain-containing protein [Methylomicrobium]EIC30364.1 diguanylate cyclase (GGDEF) domain-containing protein [Methylomicrobium album BG8]
MKFFTRSADKNSDVGTDKWKNKYLDLLDAHERLEKAYKEEHETLIKIIIRLSIVSSEVDAQLEPYLQRIRDHLKNGIDNRQLKEDLESLTKIIYQLKDLSSKGSIKAADTNLLFEFLLQRYTSSRQQKELTQLKESGQPLAEPRRLFAAIARIIESDPVDAGISRQHGENESSVRHSIDTSFVSAQLLKLLEKIKVPEAFEQKVQNVKQQLNAGATSHSLESILDSIISLLIEINTDNQPKKEEIDKFLAQITEQLAALSSAITDSNKTFKNVGLNRSKFDQSVSEQMSDLQYRSLQATQLESLQKAISSHIDKITREIQENKKKEAIELEKFQLHMERLNQKIQAMEMETGELKSKLVVANSRAFSDALTGLPNRLAYDNRLKYEIAHWQRYHTPLCLLIWDIDFFKKINDNFGHQLGDAVLKHVGRLFSENIRKTDFVARLGGEEFVVLMPNTRQLSAFQKAENLRDIIEKHQLNLNGTVHCITVSCGIAQLMKGDTYELIFERADRALYQAKKRGRNRCCMG